MSYHLLSIELQYQCSGWWLYARVSSWIAESWEKLLFLMCIITSWMLIFVNIEVVLYSCALFFCLPLEVWYWIILTLACASFLLHHHCKLKHRDKIHIRLCSIEDTAPSASLQYKLFSEPVQNRKISGKRLQDHKMAKVGMNIWRSCYPVSCSEQTQPEQAAQGQSRQVKAVIQLCPGYLQGWRPCWKTCASIWLLSEF